MPIKVESTEGRQNLARLKELVIAINSTPTGSEQDSGVDLPDHAIVQDVYIHAKTAEATGTTKTLDVGLLSSQSGGDADGFLDGVSVASVGVKTGTLLSSGQTRGAKIRADESGGGVLVPEHYSVDAATARRVSFTAGSADWEEFRGSIHIVYLEIKPEV